MRSRLVAAAASIPSDGAEVADQSQAPYLEALVAHVARDTGRLHIPGHKGYGVDPALSEALGATAIAHDLPAGLEWIDLGAEPTAFQRAQALAADAWGAKRSWFLLNGASGGNHAICMTFAHAPETTRTGPPDRGTVIVQRNVHSSIIDGLVLSGLRPAFVPPQIDPELGIAHCVLPESLEATLDANPDAEAVMLVSPTYFGAVARVAELAEIAHARELPLVVDEAWGAHMYFNDSLPTGALASGADVVLSSTHKIVGSLGQSAILHLGRGELVDEGLMDRSVTLVESTSPSALLTASLDAQRRFAATRGQELLTETIETLTKARQRIGAMPGFDVLDEELADRTSVEAWDPLRLSIDVRGTGATGHTIARLMSEQDDLQVELFSENVIVAVFGMGEKAGPTADRLIEGLEHASEKIGPKDVEARRAFAEPPPWGPLELAPRDAFLGAQQVVPFDEAEGRIAAESLAAYPPGVPNVLPGERLTAETLAYIADSLAYGGLVRGASDRTLKTIRVVRE